MNDRKASWVVVQQYAYFVVEKRQDNLKDLSADEEGRVLIYFVANLAAVSHPWEKLLCTAHRLEDLCNNLFFE